jgi:hypothetical protein
VDFISDASEFFRPQHGYEEIAKQDQRDAADNEDFHKVLLERLAGAQIRDTGQEEAHQRHQVNQIVHIR